MMTQMLDERLTHNKGIKTSVKEVNPQRIKISFSTDKTLAPNFNEAIQIEDFLYALQSIGEMHEMVQPLASESDVIVDN